MKKFTPKGNQRPRLGRRDLTTTGLYSVSSVDGINSSINTYSLNPYSLFSFLLWLSRKFFICGLEFPLLFLFQSFWSFSISQCFAIFIRSSWLSVRGNFSFQTFTFKFLRVFELRSDKSLQRLKVRFSFPPF